MQLSVYVENIYLVAQGLYNPNCCCATAAFTVAVTLTDTDTSVITFATIIAHTNID